MVVSDSSPESGRVSVGITDGVATLSFFHPKGNSLPARLLADLGGAVASLGRDDAARVIVLRSEGAGPFCAGASFQELQAIATPEQGQAFFMGFARLMLAMIRCPKFILARVHGKAVGGGVGMIAAADYAVAVPNASVKLSELAVGIGPFVVGPVIERKIGLAAFSTLAVSAADWRGAAWACEKGLFAELRDNIDELDFTVAEQAAKLATFSPEATAKLKAVLWQGTADWDRLLAERAALSGGLVLTEYAQAAISGRA